MIQEIFRRFEKKYIFDREKYLILIEQLSPYIEGDLFSNYTVNNVYYDTDNYSVIRNSIQKPVYKEKLRLRSYGTPKSQDVVFFELKKKYKKEVFKRRITTTSRDFEDYTQTGALNAANSQILSEINYFINSTNLKPKLFLAYDRQAFKGKSDANLRITFDTNIRYRTDKLDLSQGDYGKNILPEGTYLMEIKFFGAIPIWLSRILNLYGIYSQTFSKYGYCYTNYINSKLA